MRKINKVYLVIIKEAFGQKFPREKYIYLVVDLKKKVTISNPDGLNLVEVKKFLKKDNFNLNIKESIKEKRDIFTKNFS